MRKICECCKTEFNVPPSRSKVGKGRFCSRKCKVGWYAMNVHYAKNKKRCPRCEKVKSVDEFYKRKKYKIPSREYQDLCKPCYLLRCKDSWNKRKTSQGHLNKMKEYYQNVTKVRRMKERLDVIYHYGSKCACCGESNIKFLTLDHVNNDGAEQRKRDGNIQSDLPRYIIKNDYPSDIQVLCLNCNSGRYHNKGICPHKEEF